ncbi:MAG: hypothetical protein ACUZ9M_10860 [Candidatus Scalindua sp.]
MDNNLLEVLQERVQSMKKQLQRNISTRDRLNDKIEKLETDVMAYQRTLLTEKALRGQKTTDQEVTIKTGRFSDLPPYKAYLICLEEMAKEVFVSEGQIWKKATEEGLQVDNKPIKRVYSRSVLSRLLKNGKAKRGERLGQWKYNTNGTEESKIEVTEPYVL